MIEECCGSHCDILRFDRIEVGNLPEWATAPRETVTLKIFLASSAELRADRDEFERYFRRQNDRLRKQGLYLQIVRWENFLDAMSETRLQDEDIKEVRACDIFVSLFKTKAGKFTAEEFDIAFEQFQKTGKPRIYSYFKGGIVNSGRSKPPTSRRSKRSKRTSAGSATSTPATNRKSILYYISPASLTA